MNELKEAVQLIEQAEALVGRVWAENVTTRTNRMADGISLIDRAKSKFLAEIKRLEKEAQKS